MSATSGNRTVDRIQQEIQESLEREKELRIKYNLLNNNINNNNSTNENGSEVKMNGFVKKTPEKMPEKKTPQPAFAHVAVQAMKTHETNGNINNNMNNNKNGHRLFTQNSTTRGVMQKFYQMRGKMNLSAMKAPTIQRSDNSTNWTQEAVVAPPMMTIEPGRDLRNGFVPAKVKMEKELQEFQRREQELRNERRKSQPNLMAALELEDEVNNYNTAPSRPLQAAYSATSLNNDEEWDSSSYSSTSISNHHSNNHNNNGNGLKRSQSLAALCDMSDDDELAAPGTHSLIMQFEKMNKVAY